MCFEGPAGFDAAIEFADALASSPGITKKSVTLLAAPIPDLLLAATPLLKGSDERRVSHAVFVLVAEIQLKAALQQMVADVRQAAVSPTARPRPR